MDPSLIPLGPGTVRVEFVVRWFGLLRVRGTFASVTGAMRQVGDGIDLAIEVDGDTVRSGVRLRDAHLRAERFLHTARFPRATFRGKVRQGARSGLAVDGVLRLRGVERAVHVEDALVESPGPDGTVLPVSVSFPVSREEHHIARAAGLARLNPLLWAIGADVWVSVQVMVPVRLLQPEARLAPAR